MFNFFKKETLESKVKNKYSLTEYELRKQRNIYNNISIDNRNKSNDDFLNYILLYGILTDSKINDSSSNTKDVYSQNCSEYNHSSSSSSNNSCSSSSSSSDNSCSSSCDC